MTEALKSRTITNLDSIPVVYDSAGFNIAAFEQVASDYCTPTAGGLVIGSTYQLVRVRSNTMLRSLKLFVSTPLDTNVAKTLAFNIGVNYSDSTEDGTPPQLQGTVISANALGAAIVSPATANVAGSVEVLDYAPANMDQMLWDFLGLSSDPMCWLDIVATVSTAAATGAAGQLGAIVSFAVK